MAAIIIFLVKIWKTALKKKKEKKQSANLNIAEKLLEK